MNTKTPRRLVVGISGASGTIYGIRMLEMLKKIDIETHLVMSKSAEMTLVYETQYKPKDNKALASVVHRTQMTAPQRPHSSPCCGPRPGADARRPSSYAPRGQAGRANGARHCAQVLARALWLSGLDMRNRGGWTLVA